jgi:AcrR family transcriptional regulator
VAIADAAGLGALTIRSLAESIQMTTMSVYTHVNSRDDLLVLMADHVHARMPRPAHDSQPWQSRVREVAESNLSMLRVHEWMLEVDDPRIVLGPGTIAKYDHELHAFDGTGLDGVRRDAALTFVLGFARDAASRVAVHRKSLEFGGAWERVADRLQTYLGDAHPLAQSVGRAAGEAMGAPYDVDAAWAFGLGRVIAGLDAEITAHL